MAGVTVREILTLPPLARTEILAGASGLDREVRGVNVMEVPDIETYVAPGEVLLTTAYPVRDNPARLVEMLPELAARGLAALAIKPLRYLDHIPEELIQVADDLAFPVLVVAGDTSFNEVIGAVLSLVIDLRMGELFLEELITSHQLEEDFLRQRARMFGWKLAGPLAVVIAECRRPVAGHAGLLAAARAGLDPEAVAWVRGQRVVAIAPWPGTGRPDPDPERWHAELEQYGARPTVVAVGTVVERLSELVTSHQAARQALQIGRRTGRRCVRHDELSFERMILAAPTEQLRAFIAEQIGPLIRHDAERGTDLCHTLEVYLDLGNAAATARRVFVHYNTMKHRLRRIVELTGAELNAPRTRMLLALALEARRLIGDQPPGPADRWVG